MTIITFIEPGGAVRQASGIPGQNLMQLALESGIDGILGECGGCCSCATCHVYVDAAWIGRLPPPGGDEEMTLECVEDRRAGSRLACQLSVEPRLDGLRLQLPQRQI